MKIVKYIALAAALAGCASAPPSFDHTKNGFVVGKTTRGEIERVAGVSTRMTMPQRDGRPGTMILYEAHFIDHDGITHEFESYSFNNKNILTIKEPN